jgi:hypothetical protein
MNSLRPLILITPCIIPWLLWTCLRVSYPRSYLSCNYTKVKNKLLFIILRTVILINEETKDKGVLLNFLFKCGMCITEPLNQKYSVISTRIKNIAESCGR